MSDRAAIGYLLMSAGPCRADLAVGTALASVVRQETGNPAPYTDLACDVVWDRTSQEVARIATAAQQNLPADVLDPASVRQSGPGS